MEKLTMNKLFAVLALGAIAGLTALPTLVAAEGMDPAKMTCAEFSAMDSAGMMTAVGEMHKASPDSAMAMDDAAMTTAMDNTVKACEGKPDMMAMDAMMMK
jgi:zinc transporter ZupT